VLKHIYKKFLGLNKLENYDLKYEGKEDKEKG